MIAIVNVKTIKKDICLYNVKINNEVICSFKHKRSDGLSICLERASKAVQEHQYREFLEHLKK